MGRKLRQISSTGIYHVMLRGINKQNIFFSEDDYLRMMKILRDAPNEKDQVTGKVVSGNLCTIYAYCILDNHIHILIREGKMKLSEIMQSIELRYALYYNKKYERVGHLFQGRFESEAVNDSPYFYTLLRYIHRNPVKALESKTPEEYPYSSWNEYINHSSNLMKVIKPEAIESVIKRYSLSELTKWVNSENNDYFYIDAQGKEVVIKMDNCLGMDLFQTPISDREAFNILSELSGINNPEEFRLLDAPTQILYLLQAIDHGVKIKQASRLGTITYYQIRKAYIKKNNATSSQGDSPTVGSGPSIGESKEILTLANQLQKGGEQEIQLATNFDADNESCCQKNHWQNSTIANSSTYRQDAAFGMVEPPVLQKANDAIRHIEGQSKKTYHRMHLIVEYLFDHPNAKCQDIAHHIQAGNERTRIHLVQIANANIIEIQGKARSRTYSLHSRL